MKLLANIFLSGLAILACVSCSKDEDPVLPLEGAKLSVAVEGCPGTDHCLGERTERFIIYRFYI